MTPAPTAKEETGTQENVLHSWTGILETKVAM